MKTRNLFLSLFAFAAICACNKEAQPENQVLENDAYIDLSIVAPGTETKTITGTDFANGTEEENNVKNILVAFYTSAGNYVTYTTPTLTWPDTDQTSDNPHVSRISNATLVLKNKTIVPRKLVVFLNYDNAIKTAVESSATLTELQNQISNIVKISDDGFVMTNSTYMDDDVVTFATPIAEDDIYQSPTPPAGYTPVEVYVERLAAKVNVTTPANPTIKELELNDGSKIYYYPVIEGSNFTSTAKNSFIIKKISDYSFTNWGDAWNDATNYRSYWATTYGTNDPDYYNLLAYDEIGNVPNASVYMHENTNQENLPKLLVRTSIKLSADGSAYTGTSIGNLVKVGPTYYREADLLVYIAQLLNNDGVTNGGALFSAADLKIDFVSGYSSKVVFKDGVTPSDDSKATAVLAPFQSVLYWLNGQSYFFTNIEHFGTDAEQNKYGVVRNHVYNINVTAISGLGTPYAGGIGDITPEKPSDLEYEIQAKINILKWKVVNQNVELN